MNQFSDGMTYDINTNKKKTTTLVWQDGEHWQSTLGEHSPEKSWI